MRLIDATSLEKILNLRREQCSNDYGSLAGAVAGCLKLVQVQPTIAPPPNDPLTLEELQEMGNDWVWIKLLVPFYRMESGYYIKHEKFSNEDSLCCGYPDIVVRNLSYNSYGGDWLAYRRKPEEGTQ